MTEKDTASMTTVQMKADYAASEVYSTASEPPPAYKRQSNSVKIAKITAFTIIVSSFILGAFILASSYLQAKASCDQVQALDSVLEKELMLETLQQVNKELPRAEALLGRENDDNDLQNLDKEEPMKKVEHKPHKSEHKPSEEEANLNENYGDSEEAEEMQSKYPAKIPLELDLSDLAAALLQNNKKSRMNCVVERKHAEEIVDSPSKTVALPFGMNLTTDPKKARITGERISIFCEGGNENKDQEPSGKNNNREQDDDEDIEDVESIRPMFIPFQRVPIPFGAIPQRFPLTHMPQRMEPMMPPRQQEPQHGFLRQMPPPPPPFQQLPMRPPMPPQEMQAPHPEPQRIVRIQFHQIPIREMIHVANDVPQQISVQQQQIPIQQQQQQQPQQVQQVQQVQQQQQQAQQQQRQEFPFFQIQRMPLGLALERAGITAEDLNNIQRLTENRINEEFRLLANESDEEENSSEDDDENNDNEQPAAARNNQQPQQNKPQEQSEQSEQQQQNAERQARMQELPMPIQRLILQPLPEQPRDTMTPPMPDQPMQRLPMGHPGWGRSLAQPVSIPVPMMEAQNDMSAQEDQSSSAQTAEESERPHFVQPRSV